MDRNDVARDQSRSWNPREAAGAKSQSFVWGVLPKCLRKGSAMQTSAQDKNLTSMAFSALVSCTTPTVALAMRIRRMTRGSTKAVNHDPPGSDESSKRARTKETTAEPRRIRTSWSLNWATMSVRRLVGAASGSAKEDECQLSCLDSQSSPIEMAWDDSLTPTVFPV